jgi:hypothetical protein
MSNLYPFWLQEDLAAAIVKSLPSGEFAIHHVEVVVITTAAANNPEGRGTLNEPYLGSYLMTLTNVAYRLYDFNVGEQLSAKQEAKKAKLMATGMSEERAAYKALGLFGRKEKVLLPEISYSKSIPLSDVSGITYFECEPFWLDWSSVLYGYFPQRRAGLLSFNWLGEYREYYSRFSALEEIYRQSDAIKSGRAVAETIIATETSITRLKSLLDENVISTEEFEKAKSGLVGKAADLTESVASTLRQLNSLFLSGVLTEAEFRAKKFDVLAKG